ncbi:hypothetical protein JXB12_07930 [candidate division KSB1 bacterium]|nr:hypothetical protein [candidate division KSB1 bacterium]
MYLVETDRMSDTKMLHPMLFFIALMIFAYPASGRPADEISVHPVNSVSNTHSVYQVELNLDHDIPANAIIRCRFPASFDLKNVVIGGSTTINGGFALKVQDHIVILQRSGLGEVIKSNTPVDVKFAEVFNPDSGSDDYVLQVEILANELIIAKQDVKLIISPNAAVQ